MPALSKDEQVPGIWHLAMPAQVPRRDLQIDPVSSIQHPAYSRLETSHSFLKSPFFLHPGLESEEPSGARRGSERSPYGAKLDLEAPACSGARPTTVRAWGTLEIGRPRISSMAICLLSRVWAAPILDTLDPLNQRAVKLAT